METNTALLPLVERERFNRCFEVARAIANYKRLRTRYANRPSCENRYILNRAENTLVSASINAARVVAK